MYQLGGGNSWIRVEDDGCLLCGQRFGRNQSHLVLDCGAIVVERAEIENKDNSGSLRDENEERVDKGRWLLGLRGVDTEEKWEVR